MNELALFAGAGGGVLAAELCGDRTVCAVERDAYAASVLAQRQNDGTLPPFPIWSDVCTFDGRPWRGIVDVVSGGFPCQDISIANPTAEGLAGARSGLWRQYARILREVDPGRVRVENSPMLTSRGLAAVLADLAALGFDAEWEVISAADVGAPHQRDRIWIVATNPDRMRELQPQGSQSDEWRWPLHSIEEVADAGGEGSQTPRAQPARADGEQGGRLFTPGHWWAAEPGLVRMVHGAAHRVDRIKALGNGQVPAVAAAAWQLLGGPMNLTPESARVTSRAHAATKSEVE